jgi:hypothetical protein
MPADFYKPESSPARKLLWTEAPQVQRIKALQVGNVLAQ